MAIGKMTRTFDTKAWERHEAQPEGAMEITYEGKVLGTRESNGYDDSDFYALVWDDETESIQEVQYATTRGWTYPNFAKVDATEEVQAKADAFRAKRAAEAKAAAAEAEAKVPRKGKTVKVVKGRKIAVGTVAEVGWFGVDKYKDSCWGGVAHRVGLKIDGKMEFTSADNVEVVAEVTV